MRNLTIKLICFIVFSFLFTSASLYAQNEEQKINILISEEKYDEAMSLLNTLISRDSSNPSLYYKLAAASYGSYRFSNSINPLKHAISLDSTKSSYHYLLSKCYSSLGYNAEAIKACNKAYSLDSSNLNIIFSIAGYLINDRYYKDAVRYYERALAIDSASSFALSQAGFCWLKADSIGLSTRYYEKAHRINPMDISSAQQLIINYIFLNKTEDALNTADSCIVRWPNDPSFRKLKGEMYFKSKMYKPAFESFSQCALLGDNSAALYQRLGFSYFYYASTNDSLAINDKIIFYKEAKEAFDISFKKDDKNPVTCYFLGFMHEKTGEMQEAIKLYKQAVKLSQAELTADIYSRMGDCYNAMKLYEEAGEAYKKSLSIKPNNETAINNIGFILFSKLDRTEELINLYKSLLKSEDEFNEQLKEYLTERITSLEGKGNKKTGIKR